MKATAPSTLRAPIFGPLSSRRPARRLHRRFPEM